MTVQTPYHRYSPLAEHLRATVSVLVALTILACSCLSCVVAADGSEPPDIPPLQIEASWQRSRGEDSNYRYRIQYLGETVAERAGEAQGEEANNDESGGSTASNPEALEVEESGDSANPGTNGNSNGPAAVRIKYDWSDQAEGPDLFRVLVGDGVWTRPLGLDRYLGDAVGTIELNATHDLQALNLSAGLQYLLPGWRPSRAWGHYSLLGIDLERLSPEDSGSTIHGNATIEAFWGLGLSQTTVGAVDEPTARRDAIATVTRGGNSSLDELTEELDAAHTLLASVLSAFDLQDLDIALDGDYWTTPHSRILKGSWEAGDYDLLYETLSEGGHIAADADVADSRSLEDQLLQQSRDYHTWWDLLAVVRPTLGQIHADVLRCLAADECETVDKDLAESFRSALHDIEIRFAVGESDGDEGNQIQDLTLQARSTSTRLESGTALVDLLSSEAVTRTGHSVYRGILSLEAIGWYPIGGSEPHELRGTLEPRLTWRNDASSNLSVAATYKYGYERSTRDKKVNEWFIGLNYQVM